MIHIKKNGYNIQKPIMNLLIFLEKLASNNQII